jgi:protocatechuate 3,4-dioxygenase beta subunit
MERLAQRLKARLLYAMAITRRELVERCLSTGALLLVSPALAGSAMELASPHPQLQPTPTNELGPFFKKGAPNSKVLVESGDPGLPLKVSGRVLDTRGEPLAGAVVEVWQANHLGIYDLETYHYRSRLIVEENGSYSFQTVMPGHYPGRVAQHIHYRVSAPGTKTLVTQMYFATDPVFEGDPAKNFAKDPLVENPGLIRPVTLGETGNAPLAMVTFETVLVRG